MAVVFFDFDGTLTKRDSFLLFLGMVFFKRPIRVLLKSFFLARGLLSFKLGVLDNHTFKEQVLTVFLAGISRESLNGWVEEYLTRKLPKIINHERVNRLNLHKKRGDKIYIVTASFDFYMEKVNKLLGADGLICTKAEWKGQFLTGKIDGRNCYGEEKTRRIKILFTPEDLKCSFGYADDPSDTAMMALMGTKVWL